jgi:hypothetical protein
MSIDESKDEVAVNEGDRCFKKRRGQEVGNKGSISDSRRCAI